MAGSSEVIERSVMLPVGAEEAFAWHERPGALERLIPPWERIEVLERSDGITDGDRVVVRIHEGPIALRWAWSAMACRSTGTMAWKRWPDSARRRNWAPCCTIRS